MQFRRTLNVVAKNLDANEPTPNKSDEKLVVVTEARAIRAWEDFDEEIVRWGHVVAQAAGAAGTFSGLVITGVGSPGVRWQVDEIKNLGTGVLQVRNTATIPAAYTTISNPAYEDGRFAAGAAPVALTIARGADATITGGILDEIQPNERVANGRWSSAGSLIDGRGALIISADTAVVAVRIGLRGRIMLSSF